MVEMLIPILVYFGIMLVFMVLSYRSLPPVHDYGDWMKLLVGCLVWPFLLIAIVLILLIVHSMRNT